MGTIQARDWIEGALVTLPTATRIADAVNRLRITEPVDAEAVQRSWWRVVDGRANSLDVLDALMRDWSRELVRGGNIGRVDQWVTLYGRRPKGLRAAELSGVDIKQP